MEGVGCPGRCPRSAKRPEWCLARVPRGCSPGASPRNNPPSPRAWLAVQGDGPGLAGPALLRPFARGLLTPYATYALIGVTSVISIIALYFVPELQQAMALDKGAVLQGEYWRLLTAVFAHEGFLHLGFNMYALFIVGPIVELLYGRFLYLLFYLLCGLAGSVGSFLFIPNPSVGASGAIFGMFGLLAVTTYVHKPALGGRARALTSQIVALIVINLVIGFGGGAFGVAVDNFAHIGGLVAGAWLGLTVVPRGLATLRRSGRCRRAPTNLGPATARSVADRRNRRAVHCHHRCLEHSAPVVGSLR